MTITVNTKAYNQDAMYVDAVVYTGPANNFAAKDKLLLKRLAPKPTADNPGVAKCNLRFTRTKVISSVNRDLIADVALNIPVGAAEADVDSLLSDVSALIASAIGKLVVWNHDLTH